MNVYILYFVHHHVSFAIPELLSVMKLYKIDENVEKYFVVPLDDINIEKSPFVLLNLPDDETALKLTKRCVLIKSICRLYAQGESYDIVQEKCMNLPELFLQSYCNATTSWCLNIDAFGKSYTLEEKEKIRLKISTIIPFEGIVRIRNPDVKFWILEDIGVTNEEIEKGIPKMIYFGREIAGSGRHRTGCCARDLVDKQSLKKRKYLGPTSMDHEMALIMANQGCINKSSLVIDPFVGTGSILIGCATFGAYCMGSDIDARILYGKNKTNMFSNFQQYNLVLPDLMNMDISVPNLKYKNYFNAIVCDPPYHIRASARTVQTKIHKMGCEKKTNVYNVPDLMWDLIEFSVNYLCIGGRLVYFLPVLRETFKYDDIPTHPSLKIVAISTHNLTMKYARKLITMEKVANSTISSSLSSSIPRNTSKDTCYSNLFQKIKKMNQSRQ